MTDPTDLAAELCVRGEDALAAGDLRLADELAAKAVELFSSVDAEHPDVANALVLHARVAHARSEYRDELTRAEQAAAIIAVAFREWPDEAIVAEIRAAAVAQVAVALHALGRYDDAERRLLDALPDLELRLGVEAPAIGEVWNLLGIGYKYQARFDEAAAAYARAIAICRDEHGDDSLEMATLEHNLGGLAHARGEPALAEPHARRACALREAALGASDPQVAADLAAWAAVLDDLGRFDEADAAYRRALASFESAYGERHFEVGYTLGSLGALYAGAERWLEAASLLGRARAILVDVLGDEHVEVARIDQYLAVVEHGRGDRETAIAAADRALTICTRSFAADHPRTVDARATRDAIARMR